MTTAARLRIAVDLASWSNPRGYGRFTRGLLRAFVALDPGHDVVLVVDEPTAREHDPLPGTRRVVVPVAEAPSRAASASGRRSLRDMRAMGRAVERTEPDVVLFPTLHTWFPVRTRATVVLGIHDVIAEAYPRLVFPGLRGRLLWRLKSRLARHRADLVMTVSEHAARGIAERLGWPRERTWVIEEAPDPVFRPLARAEIRDDLLRRHGLSVEEPFVVYVGGANPHKNLGTLVEALATVRSEGAEVRLAIVGDVEGDRFTPGLAALESRIEALGLEDAVTFTGRLEDPELVHVLNAARAVALPSWAEGFGLPAVEGAACGVPALATRESPLPELLAGGGVFFDPADRPALEAGLRRMLDDSERDRMATKALAAAGRLSWESSARTLLGRLDGLAPAGRR